MTVSSVPIAKGTIRPWGNSLAIRIPSEIVKMTKFADGIEVGFHVSDNGEDIVLRPNVSPAADDQDSLRALYLSLTSKVTSNMEGHEDEDSQWEPMGDENF